MSMLVPNLSKRALTEETIVSFVSARERQTSLIVMVWAGDSWVLPWAQFVSARQSGKTIDLTFANCHVVITGENLRGLMDDIAAYRLGILRGLPPDYRQKPADEAPFISQIEVRPVAGSPVRDTPA